MLTHDSRAHDFVHMVLAHSPRAESSSMRSGHDAHFGIFQCHGVAGMVVHDAVRTNDLASHLEAGDLVAPIFSRDTGS